MTPEEKAALLTFMGSMHAQAKHTDQMIVGQSNFLKPISMDIKQQFEQVYHTPAQTADNSNQPPREFVAPPPMVMPPPVGVEQAIQELASRPDIVVGKSDYQEYKTPDSLIVVLEKISLTLDRIANTLENKDGTKKQVKVK